MERLLHLHVVNDLLEALRTAGPPFQPLLLVHLGQEVLGHVLDDAAADHVAENVDGGTDPIPRC